jgi:hypothetical protein
MRSSGRMTEKRRPWGLSLLLSLAGLILWAFQPPAAGAAELKAELNESNVATVLTGQVQLTFPDGRTRLLPYRSYLQPVVTDGKVFIFTGKDTVLTGIVVYDSARSPLSLI